MCRDLKHEQSLYMCRDLKHEQSLYMCRDLKHEQSLYMCRDLNFDSVSMIYELDLEIVQKVWYFLIWKLLRKCGIF
jgi:hypothetical protein